MHHHLEFTVVFLTCITLALGAIIRVIDDRTKIRVPYTVVMLLLGIAVGVAIKRFDVSGSALGLIERGTTIDPDLIIFVFLPALVFESSYALDTHAFRKNIGAITLLAGPALVVATVLTGAAMVGLTAGTWNWSFTAALVFGALISATDPVAVVAILRECGAPKRLGVLVEGESMLNDGTSIVVFNVLLAVLIAGGWDHVGAGSTLVDFLIVVFGGIGVGLGLALIASFLLSQVFNDPMVEITITIIVAYACMIIAEGMLHVSGVMAVVTAGLWLGGPGRTRISPEVHHFLHQFWEMLGYIANTVIFFLVGLVIAVQIDQARWLDVALVLAAYAAVMVIRFVVTFSFRPLIRLVGDPVNAREGAVMSWGGLRGAVSLALALLVSKQDAIPVALRDQILLVTAGIVFLTILVNGSSSGRLLAWLGFSSTPPAVRLAELTARAAVLHDVKEKVQAVSHSRDLRMVPWSEVEHDIQRRSATVHAELDAARAELTSATGAERAAGYWQQALNMERQAYWSAFAQGTLDPTAARILDREIDVQLDHLAKGNHQPPETRMPPIKGLRAAAAKWMQSRGMRFGALQFEQLWLIYNLSRGESLAADRVLNGLDKLAVEAEILEPIRATYKGYLRAGKERLEDLRANLPEITQAIETRLAKRIQLNFERDGYDALAHRGTLDHETAQGALDRVEREMKQLRALPHQLELPETADLCRTAPMFSNLDEHALQELADMTLEQVLSPGEVLFREGDTGDSMFVVARGAIHVVKAIDGEEVVVDVLGGGDILGEMSLLTGEPRTATIRAATTVTVGKVSRESFDHLMETQPEISDGVWAAFVSHRFDNYLLGHARYRDLDRDARQGWLARGRQLSAAPGEGIDPGDAAAVFVATGAVTVFGSTRVAPTLLHVTSGALFEATAPTRVALLPPLDDGGHS